MSHPTEFSSANLLEKILLHRKNHMMHLRAERIPAANRELLTAKKYCDILSSNQYDGRMRLEMLLLNEEALVRILAASYVIQWAPDKVIPVMGRLLVDDLGAERGAVERVHIRISAAELLYQHFGITDYDQNKLIDPLRENGIELPYRPL